VGLTDQSEENGSKRVHVCEEDLIARIVDVSHRVRETPKVFERVRQSMLRRCQFCLDVGGRNFEHLL